jgi:hypothetical protein
MSGVCVISRSASEATWDNASAALAGMALFRRSRRSPRPLRRVTIAAKCAATRGRGTQAQQPAHLAPRLPRRERGLEPPAERRAREQRDNPRADRPTAIKHFAFPPKGDSCALASNVQASAQPRSLHFVDPSTLGLVSVKQTESLFLFRVRVRSSVLAFMTARRESPAPSRATGTARVAPAAALLIRPTVTG